MSTTIEALNANVEAAQAELAKLLKVKELLKVELPEARHNLFIAEKRLRTATRPDPATSRKHELETLKKRLEEAQNV